MDKAPFTAAARTRCSRRGTLTRGSVRTAVRYRRLGTVVVLLLLGGLLATVASLPVAGATPVPAAAPHVAVAADPPANGTIPVRLVAVRFSETGLPAGTTWTVAFGGQFQRSTSDVVTFMQPVSGIPTVYWVPPPSTPAYQPTPPSGELAVPVSGANTTITFALPTSNESPVIFLAASLPTNISWSIDLNHVNWTSSNRSFEAFLPNGTYNYSVRPPVGFTVSPQNGTVVITGRGLVVTLAYSPVTAPRAVNFFETGLPASTNWSVVVNTTAFWGSGPALHLNASPGLYAYTLPSIGSFIPAPTNGSFLANSTIGSVVNVTVPFFTSTVPTFAVNFTEKGLPNGTAWSVTLNGQSLSGTSSIVFNESNGSFAYSIPAVGRYHANTSSGSVTVAGRPVVVAVAFTNTTPPSTGPNYTARFEETGLATGTNWSVDLNGRTNSSTTSFVAFVVPNGSYPYTVTATGYSSTPHTGTLVVNGSASVASPVLITFTRSGTGVTADYLVKFVASGLPAGTNWSAVLNSVRGSSTSTAINFTEPNGTYLFSIGPVAGYTANISSGNVVVKGFNVTELVGFSSSSSSHSSSLISGIPAWGWAVIGLLVVILIVGVLLVMTRRPPSS